MRYVWIAAGVVVVLLVGFAVWVRIAPLDGAEWNTDPAEARDPGEKGRLLIPDDSPVWRESPEEVLAALDRIARDTPRTTVLAGSVAGGRITYVTRSALWAFPDMTTVSALRTGDGTRLAVLARARFGRSDLGVNGARVDAWIAALREALPPAAP